MSAYDPKRVFAGESFGVGRVVERGHVRPKQERSLWLRMLCGHQLAGIPITTDDGVFCWISADRPGKLFIFIVDIECFYAGTRWGL